jgi:prepilin-type N-terminal cleavage/methylation domain-containing protein
MKKAFTMLELVMVIVIIGIIAAVIIPRTGSNKTAEAAVQLVKDIRYTQHLAMIDDKYDATDANWFKKLWQITFSGNTYSIVSDAGATVARKQIDKSQFIQDIDLNDLYGVSITGYTAPCGTDANKTISFDHVGRPLVDSLSGTTAPYDNLMSANDCIITLSDGSSDLNITIRKETGYTSIEQ